MSSHHSPHAENDRAASEGQTETDASRPSEEKSAEAAAAPALDPLSNLGKSEKASDELPDLELAEDLPLEDALSPNFLTTEMAALDEEPVAEEVLSLDDDEPAPSRSAKSKASSQEPIPLDEVLSLDDDPARIPLGEVLSLDDDDLPPSRAAKKAIETPVPIPLDEVLPLDDDEPTSVMPRPKAKPKKLKAAQIEEIIEAEVVDEPPEALQPREPAPGAIALDYRNAAPPPLQPIGPPDPKTTPLRKPRPKTESPVPGRSGSGVTPILEPRPVAPESSPLVEADLPSPEPDAPADTETQSPSKKRKSRSIRKRPEVKITLVLPGEQSPIG